MTEIAVGFAVRFCQFGIEAALTLLVGVFTAGVLRRMVGPAGTRKLFGSGAMGLVRGWLAGMLLPVCALGVIPVAREMRRAGVPGGTVLAFVLAAPLLNPISFLYGLTLAQPAVILSFAAASLALSTLAGLLWDRVFARATDAAESAARASVADAEPLPGYGPRRLLAVFASALRDLTGRDLVYYLIGLAGSAVLATVIPFGTLQGAMQPTQWYAPLHMTLVGVPVFSSPLSGMMKIGLMFGHGNSVGAAFVLFTLGIGTCLGTVAWLVADFGRRRVLPWFAVYVAVVVGLAYLAQPLLTDPARKAEDHTHAFDDYCCPFPADMGGDSVAGAWGKVAEKFGPLERPPVYALGGMIALGVLLRRRDRDGRVERWLTARDADTGRARPKWDVVVPGPVLGGLAILGLVGFSVIGAFVYYPEKEQCLKDLVVYRTEAAVAVNTGHKADAMRTLEELDLISRKLEVGVFLRTFRKSAEQSEAGERYREALEAVRDAFKDGHPELAKKLFQLRPDERRVRDAVRTGDWATARAVVDAADAERRQRAAEDANPRKAPPRLFSAELGVLWPAIQAGNADAATAALAELGFTADTVAETYDALRAAFNRE